MQAERGSGTAKRMGASIERRGAWEGWGTATITPPACTTITNEVRAHAYMLPATPAKHQRGAAGEQGTVYRAPPDPTRPHNHQMAKSTQVLSSFCLLSCKGRLRRCRWCCHFSHATTLWCPGLLPAHRKLTKGQAAHELGMLLFSPTKQE
jgi:hypothetical protein